jgi:tight adherence protein B
MLVPTLAFVVVLLLGLGVRHLVATREIRGRLRFSSPSKPRLARSCDPSPSDQLLAALLDDIARRCASGDSLTNAFVFSGGIAALIPVFDHTLVLLRHGATLGEALPAPSAERPSLALVLHVLGLCARVGGNVSESLDRGAATLRERDSVVQERIAQSAQARLSARVLTLIPVAFACWTLITSAQSRAFMFTAVGMASVGIGLSLNVAGSRLMSRIITGAS